MKSGGHRFKRPGVWSERTVYVNYDGFFLSLLNFTPP